MFSLGHRRCNCRCLKFSERVIRKRWKHSRPQVYRVDCCKDIHFCTLNIQKMPPYPSYNNLNPRRFLHLWSRFWSSRFFEVCQHFFAESKTFGHDLFFSNPLAGVKLDRSGREQTYHTKIRILWKFIISMASSCPHIHRSHQGHTIAYFMEHLNANGYPSTIKEIDWTASKTFSSSLLPPAWPFGLIDRYALSSSI